MYAATYYFIAGDTHQRFVLVTAVLRARPLLAGLKGDTVVHPFFYLYFLVFLVLHLVNHFEQ